MSSPASDRPPSSADSKLAEQRQRDRVDQFAEVEAHKDEFLAMLAHELRNPLAAISASLAVIEQSEPKSPADARARQVGRRQLNHLARLVDGLLDASRVLRGVVSIEPRPVAFEKIVEEAVRTVREGQLVPKGQQITLVVDGEERSDADVDRRFGGRASKRVEGEAKARINGDPARLDQLVMNLLDNASKFSDANSRIEVRLTTRQKSVAESSTNEQNDSGTTVVLTVSDQGEGIDAASLAHVFDLFYQGPMETSRRAGGLGLGLTVVRNVAELHGGTVTIQSAGRGKGTTAIVTFPLLESSDADATATTATSFSTAEAPSTVRAVLKQERPLSVLLVEDNDDVAEMMEELLRTWGHHVVRARDGFAGARLGTERAFDVGIIDVGLPGIDGCEVARRIRAHPHARASHLVALTGYGSPEMRANTREAGFDRHIVKPPNARELRTMLENVPHCEVWHADAESRPPK